MHHHQHLFETLQNVCGFTALQGDMDEIIRAVDHDHRRQLFAISQANPIPRYPISQLMEMRDLLDEIITLYHIHNEGPATVSAGIDSGASDRS